MSFTYASGKTPKDYKCDKCPATGVKLWREYNTFADQTALLCAACACKQEGKENNVDAEGLREAKTLPTDTWSHRTDQIGWMIPAVPCENMDTYWGYSSVPKEGVEWWRKLPVKLES